MRQPIRVHRRLGHFRSCARETVSLLSRSVAANKRRALDLVIAGFGAAVIAAMFMPGPAVSQGETRADLLISGARLVDGTGAPARRADVAIANGRIIAVGQNLRIRASRRIDAGGLIVAPGFIDVHNHSDFSLREEANRLNENFLRQGVTTVVSGADGERSPGEIRASLADYRRHGIATNIAFYVGHNQIRAEVMGDDQDRAPTRSERVEMQARVREGFELGAVGFATGLMYSPGLFSETSEVVELAKVAAPFQGIYISHIRDPHRALLQSNWEAIEIGRQAGLPVLLTHLTTPGRNNRGLMRAVIEQIEDARRDGQRVFADQYPYPAVATVRLWAVLSYPPELELTSREAIRAALSDPARRARIRQYTLAGGATGFNHFKASGPASILVLVDPSNPRNEGRFISEIAEERNTAGFEAIADLLVNSRDDIVVSVGGFYEDDMARLMRQPWTIISTDGSRVGELDTGPPDFRALHPRSTGTYPRILGRYVREQRLLTLEDAIRKMTSMPAEFLGLQDRGRIATGYAADLVLFDPARIADRSTWREPALTPTGIVHLLVNGRLVIEAGRLTGASPGAFLSRGRPAQSLEPNADRNLRRSG